MHNTDVPSAMKEQKGVQEEDKVSARGVTASLRNMLRGRCNRLGTGEALAAQVP